MVNRDEYDWKSLEIIYKNAVIAQEEVDKHKIEYRISGVTY